MNDRNEVPPLAADLRSLLDSERTVPPQPTDVRARVMARARAAVLAQPSAPRRRAVRWHERVRFAAAAGLILVATAGAMAGVYTWRRTSTVPATESLRPEPARRAVAAPPAAPESIAPTERSQERPHHAKAPPRTPSDSESYGGEIALLRQAQEQAAHGRFEAALTPLGEHARRFPTGRLIEEREALRIEALSKLGRTADACRAAETFRRRFPRSVLSPRASEICSPEN